MEKLQYEDLSQRVYGALKHMILTGELKSGQKLVQDELARNLGVSRTPLLTALSKLEREMLVRSVPRRGSFVRRLTPEELVHVWDIRLRLETLGARDAAANATPEAVKELASRTNAFKSFTHLQKSAQPLVEADYYFHMQVMHMSGNLLLYDILSSFNIVIMANLGGLLKEPMISAKQHAAIYRAIKTKMPKRPNRRCIFIYWKPGR